MRRPVGLKPTWKPGDLLVLNDDDVADLVRAAVKREGGQVAFAKRHGINRTDLNRFLNGRRGIRFLLQKPLEFAGCGSSSRSGEGREEQKPSAVPLHRAYLAPASKYWRLLFLSQASIIERAIISASSRVPKTVLSFGNTLPGG